MTIEELKRQYEGRLQKLIDDSREIGRRERTQTWSCNGFEGIIERRGSVGATKYLIFNPPKGRPFFEIHRKQKREHLSVEWIIINESQWHPLFTIDEEPGYVEALIKAADMNLKFGE